MHEENKMRCTEIIEALHKLDGKLTFNLEPESVQAMLGLIEQTRDEFDELHNKFLALPKSPIELVVSSGLLRRSILDVVATASALEEWCRHRDEDDTIVVMPLVTEKFREAVQTYLERLSDFTSLLSSC